MSWELPRLQGPKALLARWRRPVLSSRYFTAAVMFAAHLFAFFLARLVLLTVYYEDFEALSFGELLLGFARGFVFDAQIILACTSLPLFVMILPFDWAVSRWCRLVCGWYVFAILAVFAFVLGGDVVYFREVHRHAGPETWAVGNDLVILFVNALHNLHWIILVLAALGGVGYGWNRLLRLELGRMGPTRQKIIAGAADFVILIVIVIGIRGGLQPQAINIVNAFQKVPVPVGNLALNGPFSISHALLHFRHVDMKRLPWEEAVGEVRELLASDRDTFLDEEYPLLRERKVPEKGRPNVVIIMMESWGATWVDSVRAAGGLEVTGATPEFDALTREGLLATRFYASGSRSVYGLAAILAGLPTPSGAPYIGLGMEQNQLGYLCGVAKRHGYRAYAFQGSPRGSFRFTTICYAAGFDEVYGWEDTDFSGHVEARYDMGAWDYDMFVKANEVLATAEKPFLAFLFTLTTHPPYEPPSPKWRRPGPDTYVNRYLSVLSYSDWALGEFIRMAKKSGYYDDTVFVIVADHSTGACRKPDDLRAYYHIPLLVIAPELEPGVSDTIGCQTDLVPTIMDLAGWSGRYAAMGRSLLEEDRPGDRFALCVHGNLIIWVQDDGWIVHDLKETVESHADSEQADFGRMGKRALAAIQLVVTILDKNRVFVPEEP